MKTRLKHILRVEFNNDLSLGKETHLMVWSPVDHYWYYEDNFQSMDPKHLKFLLKQEVIRISLRNDSQDCVAVFLKDYGKVKNKQLKDKLNR